MLFGGALRPGFRHSLFCFASPRKKELKQRLNPSREMQLILTYTRADIFYRMPGGFNFL